MKFLLLILGCLVFSCNSTESESNNKQSEGEFIDELKPELGEAKLQTGDLIFHTSRSTQSRAIQIATNSKYSHMGIIYKEGSEFYVYEAVQPVKITKFDAWVKRGKKGKYVVKRLKNSKLILTEEGIGKMRLVGKRFLGKDYDLRFEWSDDKIYCSELVWKIYKEAFNIEIGRLEKIGDFDLSNKAVQEKVAERYGTQIPENELVITPDRMFKAENLIKILEK